MSQRPAPDKAIEENSFARWQVTRWCRFRNRIVNSRLRFDGRDFELTPNFPPSHTPSTGWAGKREWTVAKQSASELTLKFQHDPDAQWLFLPLPQSRTFAHRRYAHGVAGAPIPNTADACWLGFHPFFPRS